MNDGAGVIAIEMPLRAEDAAIVPVTLRATLPPGDTRRVVAITLVIDQNPAPMAARFELGPDASVSEISTRVRVNNYTDVHAVAELSDGKLYVTKTYVKASGGCSAPAAKNAEEAKGRLGQMRFRQFAKAGEGPASGAREAQIMIGHPNNSGLQMDQVTQLYIPAFFVNELRVWQDDSSGAGDGRRNFDFRGSEYPVHLCPERREAVPRRGQGHRGPRIPERMEGRGLRHLTRHAVGSPRKASARCRSETPHFGFRLGAPQIVQRAIGLFGRAKLAAKIAPHLGHAQHGFGGDVAIIRQQRREDIDRAGALIDRLPGFAVGFHAAEHILHPRIRRIIVDVIGARGNGGRSHRGQHADKDD